MPGNSFLKFTGGSGKILGESLQDGYEGKDGWLEIGDWSWDIEADTNFLKGGGASVGKPTPGTLSWAHSYDKSSSAILARIVTGTSFTKCEIHMLKQTGAAKPQLYFSLDMSDVFITKVSSKGGEDGAVTQDVEMVFKKVLINYKPQKNDGTLDSAMEFGWDIAAMKIDVDK